VSSPPVAPPRACGDGFGRVRVLRARKAPAGFLALAASFLMAAQSAPLAAQFPIRQLTPRLNVTTQNAPPANPLPAVLSGAPAAVQPPQTPHPAVARIIVPEKGAISYGSGTLVDARGQFGLVVTNWHVVRDAGGQVSVEFPGGFKSSAQVVKTDKDWDLAALSIQRPPVAPVPIATGVPQLGQSLTIAGYGSGDYRAASGSLANFVSPSPDLPQEMLDLAGVEARQGDSGGPIFNPRGELCGVLFGAGHGYTNGSYGPRVLNFLASVVPGGRPGNDGPPPPDTPPLNSPLASAPLAVATSPAPPVQPPLEIPLLAPPPQGELAERFAHPTAPAGDREGGPRASVAPTAAEVPGEVPAMIHNSLPPRFAVPAASAGGVDLNQAPPTALAAAIWRQVGGISPVDQGKTVLAIIGVLSLLLFGWRISRQVEPDVEED